MDIKEVKKIIDKGNWYKQGAAIRPLYISYPWYSCNNLRLFGKKIKHQYFIMIYFHNNFMEDYFDKKSLKNVAFFYYKKQLKDEKFIDKFYLNWSQKYVKPYLKILNKIFNQNIAGLKNKELLDLFFEFTKKYRDSWCEVIFLDSFDLYGDKILNQILNQYKLNNIDYKDLQILLTPPKPSFLQKERLNILRIVNNLKAKKIDFKNLKNNDYLKKSLKSHSKNFYWLNNDFASVEYLAPSYFYKQVVELLKNKKKYDQEKDMHLFLKKLESEKNKIIKKHKINKETTNLIKFLSILGNLRDERKSYNQMAGNVLRKFVKEFSQRTSIDIKLVENFYHWEVKNIFNIDDNFVKILKTRMRNNFNISISSTKYFNFFGKKGGELNDYINKKINSASGFKGMVAYQGKVKGEVKIIRDKNDFCKMKKGDILISSNTRPEFLPIMKIAKAIITEEGGITCHSAIVSRELKIPCIVGAQGLISALKDNDKIEVDAYKGKIKIIK